MFILKADKNRLWRQAREPLTSGSVNVNAVRFEFSPDWEGLTRTAVFEAGEVSRSVLLDGGGECFIPWEVLRAPDVRLRVGVYGKRGEELVLPTVWESLGVILEGVSVPEDGNCPPTPELWEQALSGKGDGLEYDGLNLSLMSGTRTLDTVQIAGGGGGVAPGPPGADGKSAYEIAIDNGFEGTEEEWLASLKGAPGADGKNGKDGADGVTPDVQVGTVATLAPGRPATVTRRKDSPDRAPVFDFGIPRGEPGTGGEGGGAPGEPGKDGEDGATFTPAVSDAGVLSWSNDKGLPNPAPADVRGPSGADGAPGKDGADGFSPAVDITPIEGGHTVTLTDADGPQSFDVMDGQDGGSGATFTPSVSENGVLSWSNDKGLTNPEPVDIKGPPGAGAGGTPLRPVTSAEYNALSDGDKQSDVAWMITDDEGEETGGGPSSEGDVYTAEETRIGTWIDGRPLYRRVYAGTLPARVGNIVLLPKDITVVSISAAVTFTAESLVTVLPFPFNAVSGYGNMLAQGNYLVLQGTHTVMLNKPYHAIIQYTKTTDEPEVK